MKMLNALLEKILRYQVQQILANFETTVMNDILEKMIKNETVYSG